MKTAYLSPAGGEYVAILDKPDPLLDHRVLLGQLVRVTLDPAHPAHNLTSLGNVAHDGTTVRRFGGA